MPTGGNKRKKGAPPSKKGGGGGQKKNQSKCPPTHQSNTPENSKGACLIDNSEDNQSIEEMVNGNLESAVNNLHISDESDNKLVPTGTETNIVDGASNIIDPGVVNSKQQVVTKKQTASSVMSHRSVTGVLASHVESRDLHMHQVSVACYGTELLSDAKLELNCGRRYGLVGLNGCGKSTLLQSIAASEFPIPDHFDIYLHSEEAPSCVKSALQLVMEVDEERCRLEEEVSLLSEQLNSTDAMLSEEDNINERLSDLYDRLTELDSDTAEVKAGELLFGLGFTKEMMGRASKDFSGGWRMRIALARALFVRPQILLLDEPTNHLDLNACVWLEQELLKYKRILVLVSHSQDFLNGVCTNIIHFNKMRLFNYGGNYDSYAQTRCELEEHQMKQFSWEQGQIKHMKEYVARFGHGSAKLAKQAQSKEKVLSKMVAGGLTEKVVADKIVHFSFPDCGTLPAPVVMVQDVSFSYTSDPLVPPLYRKLDFGVDLDTRVALVGPNGVGKSTLLKLIEGALTPVDGIIRRHSHLRIGRYHQHLKEQLDLKQSACEYLMQCYPDSGGIDAMRRALGQFGLSGKQQMVPMGTLSDGQRCRVVFAWIAWSHPHLLLLDEPTNHLDMETIDALADAINEFKGGMILVSHDFRLIRQVSSEIWVVGSDGTISKWEGNIFDYKEYLKKQLITQPKHKTAKHKHKK